MTSDQCPQHTEHALRAGTGMVGRVFPNPKIDREGRWEFCEIEEYKRWHLGVIQRWVVALWMLGSCPMSVDGCRKNHLCQHCFENAIIDFDLEHVAPIEEQGESEHLVDLGGLFDENGDSGEHNTISEGGNCMECGAVGEGPDHCQG